jgi:drug/metabolite transporter (DMT)-like permease
MKEMESEKNGKNTGSRIAAFVLLHVALLIYSTSGLFSKNASAHPFGSLPFILYYAGMILVLGIYAILWQQVIKRLDVTLAFANKAVTVVWGVLLGMLFFGEKISLRQAIACGVIILGTVLYVLADHRQMRSAQISEQAGLMQTHSAQVAEQTEQIEQMQEHTNGEPGRENDSTGEEARS